MNLKNCIECGKICLTNPSKLCPSCYEQEDVFEERVREYLREVGKATIEEIHKATGVSGKIITRMLKSGRLTNKGRIGYPCEMCRETIYDGRFCVNCNSGLTKDVNRVNESMISEQFGKDHKQGMRLHTK